MENLECEVRVLTWNIHGGVGIDCRHDMRRIRECPCHDKMQI